MKHLFVLTLYHTHNTYHVSTAQENLKLHYVRGRPEDVLYRSKHVELKIIYRRFKTSELLRSVLNFNPTFRDILVRPFFRVWGSNDAKCR